MNTTLLFYGAANTRRRLRNAKREALALKELQETREVLTEDASAVGFWLIPGGQGRATKLKISASYKMKGKSYPVVSGDDVFAAWAVVANYKLLNKHLSWLSDMVAPLADDLTRVPMSDSWTEAMRKLSDGLLGKGWCNYLTEVLPVPRFDYQVDSSALAAFGREFFGGEPNPPTALAFDYENVQTVLVTKRGRGRRMGREQFARVLDWDEEAEGEDGEEDKKRYYGTLTELLGDLRSNSVDYHNIDWNRFKFLMSPGSVNSTVRNDPNLLGDVALFLGRLIQLSRKNKWKFFEPRHYSAEVEEALTSIEKGRARRPLTDSTIRPTRKANVTALVEAYTQQQVLLESKSFSNLLANTRTHGRYRVGGAVRVNGRWTNDVMVPGRVDNARFVIASPPLSHIEPDGSVIYRWKFKSRSTRSTTGEVHRGYLRVSPKKRGIMAFLKRLIQGDGPWEGECQTWCSCPDFRYVSHFANWSAGASHKPTGQNGDSTLAPPVRTNPRQIPMLCKHLVSAGTVYLADPPKKLKDEVEEIRRLAREENPPEPYEPPEPITDDSALGQITPTDRVGGGAAPEDETA